MTLNDIYGNSPIALQNGFITLYGAMLYYQRYFNMDRNFLHDLMQNQWLSRAEIEARTTRAFLSLVRHAQDSVPYYRNLFKTYGIDRNSIKSLQDLPRLPLLSKETIRQDLSGLLSTRIPKHTCIDLHTSGSTGKSLKIVVDIDCRRKMYAFVSRYHRWAGLENSRNGAIFAGRTIVPQRQKTPIFWRYNAVMGNHLYSTYHLSEQNMPAYLEKLRQSQPKFIDAYPSAAYLLARYMCEHGISDIRPQAILTSGETVLDYQRDVMEKAFGCRVFDQYGCTEQALFVSQCEKGSYHVHPEFGCVEILDDAGNPLPPGVVGRVVCTSFTNMAVPLIRYDLGDTAALGDAPCDCGRNFPVLTRLAGRAEDYIITPEGNRVGRLDPVFKGLDSVRLAQIVQTETGTIVINLVAGEGFTDSDANRIMAEMRKRVGPTIKIEVRLVEQITSEANGKFRAVISRCSDHEHDTVRAVQHT